MVERERRSVTRQHDEHFLVRAMYRLAGHARVDGRRGRARRGGRGTPRRDGVARRRGRRDAFRGGNRGRARSRARSARDALRKQGSARQMDGWHPPDARARGRGARAQDGIDVANTLFALVIPRASRGSETRPGRPSRRRGATFRARALHKPKHELASRPRRPRSLERARRGDGAGMAISETGDVRVPSCVTLTTTSRAAPARRIEGRRTARPAYLGIIIRSRPNANSHKVRAHQNLNSSSAV